MLGRPLAVVSWHLVIGELVRETFEAQLLRWGKFSEVVSELFLSAHTCSSLEVGGSETAVPPDGACWGLNLERLQSRWVLPCLELWVVCAALRLVCFQTHTCVLCSLSLSAIVGWFWFSVAA